MNSATSNAVNSLFGSPMLAFLWTLGPAARRATMRALRRRPLVTIWTALTAPAVVWLLHGIALWLWHVPALYDAALRHSFVHALEHTTFMTAGLLYWWHLLSPIRTRLRLTGT